ncbi:hypothetical protein AJ80_06834 [Polytolypa hystricis UAMH7299]|uniref:Protein BIG1 n=1 Tax=Polytolypa hystricis (strain UAMH7299) TaxID=1447883 RepID=A0A2B7XTK4_POLH7|nr:hypothetical protein AJ80_06834 [Polytolypa hystricis UAMH7299]
MRLLGASLYVFAVLGSLQTVAAKLVVERPSYHRSANLNDNTRRGALNMMEQEYALHKRAPIPQDSAPDRSTTASQSSPTGSLATTSSSPSTFDEQRFNASATMTCIAAMGDRNSVVNPTGMAACYNIAYFDNSTGAFEADIRLYQVSNPVDDFVGISSDDYMLEVKIPQATISEARRLSVQASSDDTEMSILHDFRHFGQLASTLMVETLTRDNLRVLLIPNITITALGADNKLVDTTLSSDTLSYLTGAFSNPDNSATNITVPDAMAQMPAIVAAATKFVLPGTSLGIFPTGLIITCVWSLLFFVAIGYGTYGRMQFRDHYRRRLQAAAARNGGMSMR